jgi:predicted nucleic acid-binding protein
MPSAPPLRIVVDTNVVFEGLTKQGSAAGYVVEAWLSGLLAVHVSDALGYEYVDVLSRKLSQKRWPVIKPVLGRLLAQAQFVTVYFSWRPISPDKADDKVIDCAMNAGAVVVTSNVRHFRKAIESLGLGVTTPLALVLRLVEE